MWTGGAETTVRAIGPGPLPRCLLLDIILAERRDIEVTDDPHHPGFLLIDPGLLFVMTTIRPRDDLLEALHGENTVGRLLVVTEDPPAHLGDGFHHPPVIARHLLVTFPHHPRQTMRLRPYHPAIAPRLAGGAHPLLPVLAGFYLGHHLHGPPPAVSLQDLQALITRGLPVLYAVSLLHN
ncbi:hypothetical protein FRB94_004129 [Tulasnella sp. JGI-2019a]|nr:hypothetical protein FRB94_004129 [Tulasnella sp. JGI-2019a]